MLIMCGWDGGVLGRYTARSGAASLIALVFGRITDRARSDLLSTLGKLSSDDTAAVRKAVAKSLPSIVRSASPSVRMDMLELLKVLAKDEQDSIRIQIIPASAVFASTLTMEQKVRRDVTTGRYGGQQTHVRAGCNCAT